MLPGACWLSAASCKVYVHIGKCIASLLCDDYFARDNFLVWGGYCSAGTVDTVLSVRVSSV